MLLGYRFGDILQTHVVNGELGQDTLGKRRLSVRVHKVQATCAEISLHKVIIPIEKKNRTNHPLHGRPLAHDRQFRRRSRLAYAQRPKHPFATLKAPESLTRRNRFGIVLRCSHVIATPSTLVGRVRAARLLNAAVHIKVRMPNRLQDAALQHVRVHDIDEIGVAPAEPMIFCGQHEERFGGIETWTDDGAI